MAEQPPDKNNNQQPDKSTQAEYIKRLISDIKPISTQKDQKEKWSDESAGFDSSDSQDTSEPAENDFPDDSQEADFGQPQTEEEQQEEEGKKRLSEEDIKTLRDLVEEPAKTKSRIPEYRVKPKAAIERPPGGPAIKPKATLTSSATKAGQTAAKTGRAAAQAAQKTGQAIAKAGQAIAKAGQATAAGVRAAVVAIAAAIETAPAWLIILLIVLFILLIVGAAAIFIRARQTPNANGASPTVAADIVDDHPLIQTALTLSDNQTMQELLATNKQKLSDQLQSFKSKISSEYPNDSRTAPTIAKIDEVLALIAQYDQPDAQKAEAIKKLLFEIAKPWSVTLNPGGFLFPPNGTTKQMALSPGGDWGPKQPGHRPNHTGIDVGLPLGTIYRASTDGIVEYVEDSKCRDNIDVGRNNRCNGGFGNAIVVRVTSDTPWKNYYWQVDHLKMGSAREFGITKGTVLKQGQIFGRAGNNGSSTGCHIHFEVIKPGVFKGRPVGGGPKYPAAAAVARIKARTIDPFEPLGWSRSE